MAGLGQTHLLWAVTVTMVVPVVPVEMAALELPVSAVAAAAWAAKAELVEAAGPLERLEI